MVGNVLPQRDQVHHARAALFQILGEWLAKGLGKALRRSGIDHGLAEVADRLGELGHLIDQIGPLLRRLLPTHGHDPGPFAVSHRDTDSIALQQHTTIVRSHHGDIGHGQTLLQREAELIKLSPELVVEGVDLGRRGMGIQGLRQQGDDFVRSQFDSSPIVRQ